MSERYINNLTGDFSICFSEHLTEHPIHLLKKYELYKVDNEIPNLIDGISFQSSISR